MSRLVSTGICSQMTQRPVTVLVSEVYPGMALSEDTLISVVVQNFHESRQFAVEL